MDDSIDSDSGDVAVPTGGSAGGSTMVIEESVSVAAALESSVADPATVVTVEFDAGALADGEPPDCASVSPLQPVNANAAPTASPITVCLMRLRCLVLSI